jgi:hypothetical protein
MLYHLRQYHPSGVYPPSAASRYCCIALLLCITLLRCTLQLCSCTTVSSFCCVSTSCCNTNALLHAVYHSSAGVTQCCIALLLCITLLQYDVLLYHTVSRTAVSQLLYHCAAVSRAVLSLASALRASVSCSDAAQVVVSCVLCVQGYIALCVSYLCVSLLRAWSRRKRSTTFSTSFSLSEVTNQEPETCNK